MDIKEILYIVVVCIVGLYAMIATAVAIVRKILQKKKNGENITLESVFWDVVEQGMTLVGETETIYKALTGATGIKTGPLKFDSVLNKVRDICIEKQIPFDKERWTKFIEKAVDLLNNGRTPEGITTETPTETSANTKTTTV